MTDVQRAVPELPVPRPPTSDDPENDGPGNTGAGNDGPRNGSPENRSADRPEPDAGSSTWTGTEMMTIAAARSLGDGQACFVGIGLPSAAANLARRLHAPNLVLIYESGAVGSRPAELPLSIGDGILAESALTVVGVPEVFNYWLQPGRIDVGFLSGAQLDRRGNINTTVIGSYDEPVVRLPGSGGAPEIAASCREVTVVMHHHRRAFVERVDFVTSVGHGTGPGERELLGLRGAGPTRVITDLGVLEPDPASGDLVLTALHPGATVEQAQAETGWTLQVSLDLTVTPAPTAAELTALRGMRTVGSS
jgi:glutaconate CoA-transferase, subunit B